MADVLLSALALWTIGSAVGVISSREAVHSALFLTVHLLGIGGFFLALQHQFLAVAQLLVYAGAVMIVFVFAVTTLSPEEEPLNFLGGNGLPVFGLGIGLVAFGALFWSFSLSNLSAGSVAESGSTLVETSSFAADLFGPFLLPFEGTAFLLLTALIGAMILGGRRQVGDG